MARWKFLKKQTERANILNRQQHLNNQVLHIEQVLLSPVRAKLHVVIQVVYVLPAVDVHSSVGRHHQHHEAQLDQVTDLHQHGGGKERHHSHEAVVLWVFCAASHPEPLQAGTGGSVVGVEGRWDAAQLQSHKGEREMTSRV